MLLLGIGFVVFYVAAVGVLAFLKLARPSSVPISWSEVFYGPAITAVSSFVLFLIVFCIDHLIRAFRRGRSSRPGI
jgi:hypothetical protein